MGDGLTTAKCTGQSSILVKPRNVFNEKISEAVLARLTARLLSLICSWLLFRSFYRVANFVENLNYFSHFYGNL